MRYILYTGFTLILCTFIWGANSYSSAQVVSSAQLRIVPTDEALVAIIGGDDKRDIDEDALVLDDIELDNGLNASARFHIKNNLPYYISIEDIDFIPEYILGEELFEKISIEPDSFRISSGDRMPVDITLNAREIENNTEQNIEKNFKIRLNLTMDFKWKDDKGYTTLEQEVVLYGKVIIPAPVRSVSAQSQVQGEGVLPASGQ